MPQVADFSIRKGGVEANTTWVSVRALKDMRVLITRTAPTTLGTTMRTSAMTAIRNLLTTLRNPYTLPLHQEG